MEDIHKSQVDMKYDCALKSSVHKPQAKTKGSVACINK